MADTYMRYVDSFVNGEIPSVYEAMQTGKLQFIAEKDREETNRAVVRWLLDHDIEADMDRTSVILKMGGVNVAPGSFIVIPIVKSDGGLAEIYAKEEDFRRAYQRVTIKPPSKQYTVYHYDSAEAATEIINMVLEKGGTAVLYCDPMPNHGHDADPEKHYIKIRTNMYSGNLDVHFGGGLVVQGDGSFHAFSAQAFTLKKEINDIA